MHQRAILVAVVLAFAAGGSASATPDLPSNVPAAYAKEKGGWKAGGCKYKYKADRKGYKEE